MTTVDISTIVLETSCLTDGTEWEICAEDGGDAVAGICESPQAQALAFLFAAAPELLACLKLALPLIADDAIAGAARNAIARATELD